MKDRHLKAAGTALLVLAWLCPLCGCLSRAPLRTQTFAFDGTALAEPKNAGPSKRVVSIRSLRVAAPFEERSFIYRVGDYSFQADPYAEFLVLPAESLRPAIRGWMQQCEFFGRVAEQGSALQCNTMAEITILDLYGDLRESGPAAVLGLRFVLLDAPGGVPGKLLFEHEYRCRVPMRNRSAEALMGGWNEALKQIFVQLSGTLRRLDAASSSSNNTDE